MLSDGALKNSETTKPDRFRLIVCQLGLGAVIYLLVHLLMSCLPSPWTPAITANMLGFYSVCKLLLWTPCLTFALILFSRVCQHKTREWMGLIVLSSMMVYPLAGLPFEILAGNWVSATDEMSVIDTRQAVSDCLSPHLDNCPSTQPISSKFIALRPEQQMSLKLDLYHLNAGSTDGFFSTLTTVSGHKTSFKTISSTLTASTESRKSDWVAPVRIIPFAEPYFWRSQSDYRSRLLRVDQTGVFQLTPVWLILIPFIFSFLPLLVFALFPQSIWPALSLALVWICCFTPWLRWLAWI